MNIQPKTDSDCEVIIHLYMKYGIEQCLQMLDGVFSFILCDSNINSNASKLYVARDPYGVRPLYVLKHRDNNIMNGINQLFGFASEMKVLNEFYQRLYNKNNDYVIEHFKPGTFSLYTQEYKVNPVWINTLSESYHSTGFQSIMYSSSFQCEDIVSNIQYYLQNAVKKRVLVTERPIACLLSGGLDSSLITALVNEYHKTKSDIPLETYSIGLEGSEDLKYASIVAKYLGTKHTEIILTEKDFLDAIPEVIYAIESYDTTSVRASIGNYLIGKYISQYSDAKVIFNGDGSDELCGGYLYMHCAPDAIEFDKECRRLLKDIYMFDVLRSDKCISSHGLEPRTPFLDRSWVQYYLSIDPNIRFHSRNGQCEKFLLRNAFSKENFTNNEGQPLLPDSILWRTKEAFSDGVSKSTRSLYQIIQDYIKDVHPSIQQIYNDDNNYTKQDTLEKIYYRNLFENYYKGNANIIPYFWMPRYVDASDASARTLPIYKEKVLS
jgi:asparagine synthase (glutamine-hydrolysing)